MSKIKLVHFYSDWNRMQSKEPYHAEPSQEVIRQAMTLGRVAVGNADIIFRDEKYIVVIVGLANGYSHNIYRDMYKIS